MSKFNQISKEVGWEPRDVRIPTLEEAETLRRMVVTRHCVTSFKRVLELKRFTPVSETSDHSRSMNVILEAFEKGKDIFERYHS